MYLREDIAQEPYDLEDRSGSKPYGREWHKKITEMNALGGSTISMEAHVILSLMDNRP